MIELFIHIQLLELLKKGKPVNAKVNYAGQYDVKILINPKKYIINTGDISQNIITIRKKKFKDIFRKNK